MSGAPRHPPCAWVGLARGALIGLILCLASPAAAEIATARYTEPTDRYPHGVLGDPSEYTTLEVTTTFGQRILRTWDRPLVYEDTTPRLVDVTGDGSPEVVVVESHERLGARFAILELRDGNLVTLAANPFIGTRFRWLAIVGIADLDGDGFIEVAYVDRPHLAKTLRVWRMLRRSGGTADVEEVAALPGITNHRIGEIDIAGGVRDCGPGPEIIVADANWSRLLSVTFTGSALRARDIGPHLGRASFADAMAC